jgi:hypothetical protein
MNRRVLIAVVCAAVVAMPLIGRAQKGPGNQKDKPPATADAKVDFGVLPSTTVPIGPPPCKQVAPFGGPDDLCAYHLHHLTPEEATLTKGGELTLEVHGGGHAPAVYKVSKDTTRNDLGQFLCMGLDPEHIADPTLHACNLSAANANAQHIVKDGDGDVVIVAQATANNPDPLQASRVWFPPGRLTSVGGQQFANGGTVVAAGAPSNGQLVTYRFLKNGRYLVICMNRTHLLNDWMFGFVNVVGDGNDDDK